MSRPIRAAAMAAVMFVLAVGAPVRALADGSWPRPVAGATALAYGQRWVDAQGRSCTHGGLDLLAPTGSTVAACCPGEVTFAGLVPAGEGARAYAVTVLTSDGLRVTYLPLDSVSVRKGQPVSAGDPLGALAGAGDGSTAAAHLHLGVKRGSAALDPEAFLEDPAARTPVVSAPERVTPGTHATPVPAPRTAPSTVPQPRPQPAHVPQVAPASGTVPQPAPAELARGAVQAAAGALSLVDPIARVEPVSAPATLDLERAAADVDAGKASLLAWGLRTGLVLLAGACVIPVLRVVRKASVQAVPIPVRRDRS